MGFSLNKIQLIGTIVRDAETAFTTNNKSVTKFSLVTEHSYKSGEEWKKEATFHNIVSWELSDYFKSALVKGAKFYVEGRLQKREYEKDGIKRYSTDVVSTELIPLSSPARSTKTENTNEDSDIGF
jgi:single-strand DNA-binding protein